MTTTEQIEEGGVGELSQELVEVMHNLEELSPPSKDLLLAISDRSKEGVMRALRNNLKSLQPELPGNERRMEDLLAIALGNLEQIPDDKIPWGELPKIDD